MRRLPVIQQTATEDAAAAARPRWHWLLIGAGFVVTLWVPLTVIAVPLGTAIAARVTHDRTVLALAAGVPPLICFGLASAAAGALVGRFGGRAGRREAALAAVMAVFLVASVATLRGPDLSPLVILLASLVLGAIGAAAAFVGAGFGLRKRSVLDSAR